ncbi:MULTISPECIES: pyruvate kinase [Bacteria]|jgi:pyruvate kinase|uniref:Pyruvate kinase n=3 Tax=cellular organisms TaxID=131567 RepID=A0A0D1JZI5_9SPHN|nr:MULTISPECIES: pyruvate kinase [Bacteria]ANC86690.1 pyruvate kinase [Sphingomonas sp. NIC1]AOW22603.1 pyruvate kinase [Sphingomonas melonis TY]ATI55998.1 pyruvate kinase [Sphingomonas melonis]KIU26603.1 pyruvate kinase [Sphingomonas melonis]KZB95476.1 pyruvate kinase [Sphingomonas melonis TY]
MTTAIAPRSRKVRVLATLGPASNSPEMIATLFQAGADAFRVNMSHGDQQSKVAVIEAIRALEKEFGRPTTILADLQGPKLRVGKFDGGRTVLEHNSTFVLDRDPTPGDATRVELPHKEIFEAIEPGARLLLDDGKLVLRVTDHDSDRITTVVEVGGPLSNNKGLNVPDVVLPMAALTEKDRSDLAFAVDQGVDWIALSFVQRPEDLWEARKLIGGKAALLAKIEKPQAIDRLEEIVEACDGVMVARGDLGVELPPQSVPPLQKRIVETARRLGRPVVVATQMLESMIQSPSPTRAEVSDVATAIYDGADAIMLSAESAAGQWPVESVAMMNSIGVSVESDPMHGDRVHFTVMRPDPTTADALAEAAKQIAKTVSATAIICFTTSGSTARRIARERPSVPLLVLTPNRDTARRLGLLWGTHAVHTRDVESFEDMVGKAKRMALRTGIAHAGDRVIVMAGVPFRTPGSTNVLHVVHITGDELRDYA